VGEKKTKRTNRSRVNRIQRVEAASGAHARSQPIYAPDLSRATGVKVATTGRKKNRPRPCELLPGAFFLTQASRRTDHHHQASSSSSRDTIPHLILLRKNCLSHTKQRHPGTHKTSPRIVLPFDSYTYQENHVSSISSFVLFVPWHCHWNSSNGSLGRHGRRGHHGPPPCIGVDEY
jgi:hypothetical protein